MSAEQQPEAPLSQIDPARRLLEGWSALRTSSVDAYLEMAGGRDLAVAATPASLASLTLSLRQLAAQSPERAVLFAAAITEHADALSDLGRCREAVALYEEALPLLAHHALPEGFAQALVGHGLVLWRLNEFARSQASFERAIGLFHGLVKIAGRDDLAPHLARALMLEANALRSRGDLALALSDNEQAVALLRGAQAQDPDLGEPLAQALLDQGVTLRAQGRVAEALAAVEQALDLLRGLVEHGRADLLGRLADALNNKANALKDQSKLAEALRASDEAVELLRRLVNEGAGERAEALARALLNRGTTLELQNKPAESLADYDEAIAIRRRLVFGEGRDELANYLANVLMNKGVALFRQGRLAEAIESYDEAIAIRRRLVFDEGREEFAGDLHSALMNKGVALLRLGKLPEAEAIHRELAPRRWPGDGAWNHHWFHAEVLHALGRQEEALGRLIDARRAYRLARRTAAIDETALEYVAERKELFRVAVRVALGLGRPEEALSAVLDAKATLLGDWHDRGRKARRWWERGLLGWLRARLPSLRRARDEDSAEVLGARRELTSWLASPESASPRREGLAPPAASYFRLWHLQRHGRGRAVPRPDDGEGATLDAIRNALAPGWAVVEFWHSDDRVAHAFVVTAEGPYVRELSFPLDELRDRLRALWAATDTPSAGADLSALDDLHGRLFAPLLPWLREHGIRGLYLVPHGFLHALPLHAARGPAGPLCDEFEVAYLPSSALLPRLPRPALGGPVFSLANPERGTPRSLPFADWEGEQIERRYRSRGGVFLRGPKATFARTAEWGDAALIHYSGHGVGDESFAPLSHLRLADDLLLAHDVVHRRPALREGAVVILNGCQTSVRDARAHDESMGLMTAFLLRGASFVLATQWAVEDRCAAEFVLAFLEQLLDKGASPTQAMRFAQRKVRGLPAEDGAGPRRGERGLKPIAPAASAEVNPLLWSAFQLVGRVT